MLSAKQGSHWYHFYNVFGMTRPGIDPTPPWPTAHEADALPRAIAATVESLGGNLLGAVLLILRFYLMKALHSDLLGQFRESDWFTELAEEFRIEGIGVSVPFLFDFLGRMGNSIA